MKLFATAVLAATVAGRGSAPNPVRTCNEENGEDQSGNGLFFEYGKEKRGYNHVNTCKFNQVLNNLGQKQMERALYYAGVEKKLGSDLAEDFRMIVQRWTILTGQNGYFEGEAVNCGLDGNLQLSKRTNEKGWIDRCEWWCGTTNHIESFDQGGMEENAKYVIKNSLNVILQLVNEYFSRNHVYKFGDDPNDKYRLEHCARVDHDAHPDDGPGQLRNRFGNKCRNTDKCGQAIRWIYQRVANFVPVVGEIGELSSYQQSWKEDKEES